MFMLQPPKMASVLLFTPNQADTSLPGLMGPVGTCCVRYGGCAGTLAHDLVESRCTDILLGQQVTQRIHVSLSTTAQVHSQDWEHASFMPRSLFFSPSFACVKLQEMIHVFPSHSTQQSFGQGSTTGGKHLFSPTSEFERWFCFIRHVLLLRKF